ncbi:MAG: DsbA family protein [Rhodospirillaceae bacterium]|jgi:protein-disulfide isomerase|nr:DsbA family protein [Rhodospirillaceae bacterium]MBT5242387.1 DsbA family protein [Rhodospirillaceae bacterium]MBT5567328.1 DsbA family protein [Rhodospirillaceae bacterium]MBT6091163.1 DsbA family protein [Rhodospirillaceae bacterium]MBT6959846.1 DsbA family protein [Rhodospirillaceae bacterium]
MGIHTTIVPALAIALSVFASAPASAIDAALQQEADARATRYALDLRQDPGTPVMGNPDGNVTVIEFFDYQCPFCKAAEPRLKELVKSDGNIKFVIKDFPILSPVSIVASKAALAADMQGKHAEFHNALMGHRGPLEDEARVFKIAANVGLDIDRLKQDMNSTAVTDQLFENFNLARKMRINVVPGYIVDGKVLSGLSSETVTSKIDFPTEVEEARAKN